MAVSTKGLVIYMSKTATTPTSLTPTGITAAKPSVITVSSTTGIANGDVAYVSNTGIKALDGKYFTVGSLASGSITLVGSNNTGGATTIGAGAKIEVYKASDMCNLCLSSIAFSEESGQTISVGTFCDPSASIATPPTTAGTVTMSGFVDKTDPCYSELLEAVSDGAPRVISIELPQGNGHIVAPITLSSISWDLPIQGAVGFTASGALGSKPHHVF
jgi:hypothetical protein